jgi:hypothetical protein
MRRPYPAAPRTYLDDVYKELRKQAPHLTEAEAREYAYGTGDGWDGYHALDYSPRSAVAEDMAYWED